MSLTNLIDNDDSVSRHHVPPCTYTFLGDRYHTTDGHRGRDDAIAVVCRMSNNIHSRRSASMSRLTSFSLQNQTPDIEMLVGNLENGNLGIEVRSLVCLACPRQASMIFYSWLFTQ